MENMLTIDKICGYLPYGLKIMNGWGDIVVLRPIHLEETSPIVFVPILHDISCLTEEIEVNGERFIPAIKLAYEHQYRENWKEVLWNKIQLKSISFQSSLLLHSWHIDIYGLIPAGLAINIKDIK